MSSPQCAAILAPIRLPASFAGRLALAVAVVAVLVVAGGVAFALLGDDAPPPPKLTQHGVIRAVQDPGWKVGAGSFAGYRVNEDYLGVGVHTAVGRTAAVTGTILITGTRVLSANLTADLTLLRSDQARRDDALRVRAIETGRYPRATFSLDGPLTIASREQRVTGTLELHGSSAPITVTVSGSLTPDRLELVGRAPIDFHDFGIEPPSVAGLVTVRSKGILEFRLRAYPG